MKFHIDEENECIIIDKKESKVTCDYYLVKFEELIGFKCSRNILNLSNNRKYELTYIFITKYGKIEISYIKYNEDFTNESEINLKIKDIINKRKNGLFV